MTNHAFDSRSAITTPQGHRRSVFVTGATGNWGRALLREFRERSDDFIVTALVLPTAQDREIISEFADMDNLQVVFGDLTDYSVVESCVRGTDVVLHVGAIVSPLADREPELANRVNVGGMTNIVRAVKAQPHPGHIAAIGIGSVAETGSRNAPHHWGRVGDPLQVSRFDEYAQSKIIAEKILVDSGLTKWAWLRQTGIFHPDLLGIRDPIISHVPFAGTMEWVSVEDSARLLVNASGHDVPEEFWGGIYNVGGGSGWRLTNWEFQVALAGATGQSDVRRWYELNWFALQNFHGHWYTDSDRLEQLIPFRQDTFEAALGRAVRHASASVRGAGKVPSWIVKNLVMKPLMRMPRGTISAIEAGRTDEIDAMFGSLARWEAIGNWTTFHVPEPNRTPVLLKHGFDETKDPTQWLASDLQEAARFRGGKLLSAMTVGAISTPLMWSCARGHEFAGSAKLVLTGGHWCPVCVRNNAEYDLQAEDNLFLAQVRP